jgi:predicted Holliday junction resolvase-like endonuclease
MHERVAGQWAPVLSKYPYEPRNFRFVGSPVDGVQFEEDRIVFVRFSSGELTPVQQRVRDLVQSGRVEWLEVRVGEAPAEAPSSSDAWSQRP